MSAAKEELARIAVYDLYQHLGVIDGYIFSGRSLDDLTIRHFISQPDIVAILHAYGFRAGPAGGDADDSRRRFRGTPFSLVEEYVRRFYPGLDRENAAEAEMTMERYFDAVRPDWRNAAETKKTRFNPWQLNEDEKAILNAQSAEDGKKGSK